MRAGRRLRAWVPSRPADGFLGGAAAGGSRRDPRRVWGAPPEVAPRGGHQPPRRGQQQKPTGEGGGGGGGHGGGGRKGQASPPATARGRGGAPRPPFHCRCRGGPRHDRGNVRSVGSARDQDTHRDRRGGPPHRKAGGAPFLDSTHTMNPWCGLATACNTASAPLEESTIYAMLAAQGRCLRGCQSVPSPGDERQPTIA